MKHLNRLTPDYHEEYMKNGEGQPVDYQVEPEIFGEIRDFFDRRCRR